LLFLVALSVAGTRSEAVAAVDWFVAAGIEWDFGGAAAVAAGSGEHFARTPAAIAAAATTAAVAAASGTHSFACLATIGHRFGLFWKPFCA